MKRYLRVLLIVLLTVIAVLAAEVCAALAVMWWGAINVGADHPHPALVRWYLDRAMTYSVQEHAQGLQAPPPAQISRAEGARHYDSMCVICHGAPGSERSLIGQGLSPDPPHLVRTAPGWTVEQVYWLVTHGVGDTGMPAFGATRTEAQRWAIAYFVKQLPEMTPEEYQRLVAQSTAGEKGL